MRVVAEGDIRCFCYEIQEMLNIHQPFAIQGIGTLSRSLDGKIHFEQEPFLPEKKNHIDHGSGKNMLIPKKPEDPPIKWGNTSYALNYHRLWLIGIFALLLGGLIILANSHTRMQMSDPEPSSKIIESSLSPNISDNLSEVSDQIKIPSTPTKISYLVVFEISDSTRAHKRYNQLTSWGDQIVIFKWDDRRYALASPFTTPPADTLHAKDSISTLFGRSVFIQYLSSSMNQKELTRIEN
ncbi:MAG: hypothetical protein K6T34_09075 [Thermoflavifilum sp.]|nr:hypothetical protein [Thermoflavifilum sp.]